jgi:hypothetical protein
MLRLASILAGFVACAAPGDDPFAPVAGDGKEDRGGASGRFIEVDPAHSSAAFRTYVHQALDRLAAHDSELARLTLASIGAGYVALDELADLTCADFLRVRDDLPALGLMPADHARLRERNSVVTAAIAAEIDGYMWSNRIYVSRGQDPQRLAATLVHEVNHVVNRSEVGYYDDLPTSAFVHEYRAFFAESLIDPDTYAGIDLVDYVLETYELDRTKIPPHILASPLTPKLLPDAAAWQARDVSADDEALADCSL